MKTLLRDTVIMPLKGESASPLVKHFESAIANSQKPGKVVFKNNSLNYHQLNAKANQMAKFLLDEKHQYGDVIALYFQPSIDYIVTLMAVLKSGKTFLPINRSLSAKMTSQALRQCACQDVLVSVAEQSRAKEKLSSKEVRITAFDAPDYESYGTSDLDKMPSADDFAYIIFTSGSTGKPKEVKVRHEALLSRCQSIIKMAKIKPNDVYAQYNTLAFDASLQEIFTALCANCTVNIIPEDIRLHKDSVTAYMNQGEAVTIMTAVPDVIEDVLDVEGLPRLRALLSTGGHAHQTLISKWIKTRHEMHVQNEGIPPFVWINAYGATEETFGSHLSFLTLDTKSGVPTTDVGKPMEGVKRLFIKLENGEPTNSIVKEDAVLPDEDCELVTYGYGIHNQYVDETDRALAEELNKKYFCEVVYDDSASKYFFAEYSSGSSGERIQVYRTHDKVAFNSLKSLEVKGRMGHSVKRYGVLVDLTQVANVAIDHSQKTHVKECCVLVDPDDKSKLIVILVAKDNAAINYEALAEAWNQNLLIQAIPNCAILLEGLPRFASGKRNVDRDSCHKAIVTRKESGALPYIHELLPGQGRLDAIEAEVAKIWSSVLEVELAVLRPDANFLYLNPSSILYVQVLGALHRKFSDDMAMGESFKLDLNERFRYDATIRRMAQEVKLLLKPEAATAKYKYIKPTILQPFTSEEQTLGAPPIIFVHSLLGNSFIDFRQNQKFWDGLNKAFDMKLDDIPVYGLMGANMVMPGLVPRNLEDLGLFYHREITRQFPGKVPLIVAWSAGGAVAMEIARYYKRQNIDLPIIMLDCVSPDVSNKLPDPEYLSFILQFFQKYFPTVRISSNELESLKKLPKDKLLERVSTLLGSNIKSEEGRLQIDWIMSFLKMMLRSNPLNVELSIKSLKAKRPLLDSEHHGWSRSVTVDETELDADHFSVLEHPDTFKAIRAQYEVAELMNTAQASRGAVQGLKGKILDYIDRDNEQALFTALSARFQENLDNDPFKLMPVVESFVTDPSKVSLPIIGDAGTGKTQLSKNITRELSKYDDLITIYIPLGHPLIKDHQRDLLFHTLVDFYELSEVDARKILELGATDQAFCFVFDGVDELLNQDQNYLNFTRSNGIYSKFKNVHCIFTSRPKVSGISDDSLQSVYMPIDIDLNPRRRELHQALALAPFDTKDKDLYIEKFLANRVNLKVTAALVKKYRDKIRAIEHLDDITSKPILIMLTMSVLDDLEMFYRRNPDLPHTENLVISDLYNMHIFTLFDRAERKSNSPKDVSGSNPECYLAYCSSLAKLLKGSGDNKIFYKNPVTLFDTEEEKSKNPYAVFFHEEFDKTVFGSMARKQFDRIRVGFFGAQEVLTMEPAGGGCMYSFFHGSFVDHFAGLKLTDLMGGRRMAIHQFIEKTNKLRSNLSDFFKNYQADDEPAEPVTLDDLPECTIQ